MKETRRIDYGDRRIIQDMLDARERLADIADAVCADPTSVSREIWRNRTALGKAGRSRFRTIACDRFASCELGLDGRGVVELVYQYDEEDDFFFVFQGMTPPSGKSLRELELERREA